MKIFNEQSHLIRTFPTVATVILSCFKVFAIFVGIYSFGTTVLKHKISRCARRWYTQFFETFRTLFLQLSIGAHKDKLIPKRDMLMSWIFSGVFAPYRMGVILSLRVTLCQSNSFCDRLILAQESQSQVVRAQIAFKYSTCLHQFYSFGFQDFHQQQIYYSFHVISLQWQMF